MIWTVISNSINLGGVEGIWKIDWNFKITKRNAGWRRILGLSGKNCAYSTYCLIRNMEEQQWQQYTNLKILVIQGLFNNKDEILPEELGIGKTINNCIFFK